MQFRGITNRFTSGKLLLVILLLLLNSRMVVAQETQKTMLNNVISRINNYGDSLSMEQVYLQTDQSSYAAGDTVWFKAYILNSSNLTAATKSGLLYIELANDSNRLVQRMMLPVFNGLTYGSITLPEESFGKYTIKAYTNWMLNFDEQQLFKKDIYITNAPDRDWLISYTARLSKENGDQDAELMLKLSKLDNSAVALKDLQIKLADAKRTWFKDKFQTNTDGELDMRFKIPQNGDGKSLSLSLGEFNKNKENQQQVFPVALNRPDYVDLQFMPEGGNLVAGIPAHVAFKALNEDGLGASISGIIYDSKMQEVTSFKSAYKGIGSFYFLPAEEEAYTAVVQLPDGGTKRYPLPAVTKAGIVMKVNNRFNRDSCEVTIYASPEIVAAKKNYFLIGHVRGMVYAGAAISFAREMVRLKFSKKTFPSGILNFTLLSSDKQPVNNRITYIDHGDQLNIELSADKAIYARRDSVNLKIKVVDQFKQPVSGSFSLAVTDNGQVKKDALEASIWSNMLLTNGLNGYVESPGYYLDAVTDEEKWMHLDNLMLAQGWTGYDVSNAFKPSKKVIHPVEPEFLIKGRITNMFNKPVPGASVTLFSKKPLVVLDTVADINGNFIFKGIFSVDTAAYFLSTKNKRNKSFNVGIEMFEFVPPTIGGTTQRVTPWYVNTDTSAFMMFKRQVTLKKEQARITGKNTIKEVVITAKKVVKDSKNVNGPGEADVILDEKDMEKAGKTTLGELLTKRVKGFGQYFKKADRYYGINSTLTHLIIDGVNAEFFKPEDVTLFEYLRNYMEYYDAEDIKGIEVMFGGQHSMRYTREYIPDPMARFFDHSFIEVTTRSGKGPFVKKSTGSYLFKPLPFTLPKKFYAPAYLPGNIADGSDIRATIHWEPDIVTDKNGEATIRFFTADQPGKYTMVIEGSSMEGVLGTKRGVLTVQKGVNN